MSDQLTAEAFTPWIGILEGAWQILPADRQISYSLFEVYLELDRQTEAERIARRLLLQAHGREGIEEIEMQLERAARDRSAQPPTHSQP